MNDEEVNKIIAEYMDEDVTVNWVMFTDSLDALVPVWEKLSFTNPFDARFGFWGDGLNFDIVKNINGVNFTVATTCNHEYGSETTYTLQQAAAYATAKVIKEMK